MPLSADYRRFVAGFCVYRARWLAGGRKDDRLFYASVRQFDEAQPYWNKWAAENISPILSRTQ